MITRFSGQQRQVRKIMQKYWYLLLADDTVSKYLKTYPEITFRRWRSLKDSLVHSHHQSKIENKNKCRGTFPCNKCIFCRYIYGAQQITLPDGHIYKPQFLVNCQSVGVVYIMLCDCGVYYVGKTKRPFFHCIRNHVSLVSKSKMETHISRHMGSRIRFIKDACLCFGVFTTKSEGR